MVFYEHSVSFDLIEIVGQSLGNFVISFVSKIFHSTSWLEKEC